MGITRKCHNHQSQTNPWHREDVTQNKRVRIQEFLSWGGGGGPGQSDKKSSDNVFFFFFFLVLSFFYSSQMVNFKEIYHVSRFQRGSNVFQGGPTFSRGGGVQLLIPYRNPYNLLFSRGVRTPCPPCPPSGSQHQGYQHDSKNTIKVEQPPPLSISLSLSLSVSCIQT